MASARRKTKLRNAYITLKMRVRYRTRKRRCLEYKGSKCERCGYSKSQDALEFHHTDPSKKDFSLSRTHSSWEKIKAELDKCLLLCANCHREEHERLIDEKHAVLEALVRSAIPERASLGKEVILCARCEVEFEAPRSLGQRFCSSECSSDSQTRIKWPSDRRLKKLVWEYPVSGLASKLGVSGVAIKKRCAIRGIATPGRGYWTKYRNT